MTPIKYLIKNLLENRRNYNMAKETLQDDYAWLGQLNILDNKVLELTTAEYKAVKEKWDLFPIDKRWIKDYMRIYKYYCGFNVNFVPGCCYYPYIIRALNPIKEYEIFEHKGLFSRIFYSVNHPRCPLRRIKGIWYDEAYNPVTLNTVWDILINKNNNYEIVIKSAVGTCGGKGVNFLPINSTLEDIKYLVSSYDEDIVIQLAVKQSYFTSKLNPSSLNTLRLSTLNLNGKITVVSSTIKRGGEGKRVDNIGGEGGGIMCGIYEDGRISSVGFTRNTKIKLNDDTLKIPNYEEVKECVIKAHTHIPHLGLAGWDVALNIENIPEIIELNLWWPGIMIEQLAAGPFFGDRTEEILEFLKYKQYGKDR